MRSCNPFQSHFLKTGAAEYFQEFCREKEMHDGGEALRVSPRRRRVGIPLRKGRIFERTLNTNKKAVSELDRPWTGRRF
jgi:hypothetical protein